MRNKKQVVLTLGMFICSVALYSQDFSAYKFGKVTVADFSLDASKFDSGANAVIIADVGKTIFEGNDKGFFTLIFTRFMRVKIMNKNGMGIGSQEITLRHNGEGDVEKLVSLKATTFNMENGLIRESKLEEKAVFTEKYNNDIDVKKFSLPALKEGAIFDLVYVIKSPYIHTLRPWSFQGEYPRLWSEYEVTIPPVLHYVMKMQGEENFDVNTTKEAFVTYSIRQQASGSLATDLFSLSGNSVNKHWVKKDVPALHEESYTTSLDNYYTRVSFQLNFLQWSADQEKHEYMPDWKATCKTLLEDEDFGIALTRENNWMSDELKTVVQGSNSEEDKTSKIYKYVRDNFSAVEKNGYSKNALYTQNSLKQVFKNKEGNVAEINLLLTAMLRKAGVDADPLILSTRDHGIANVNYPLIREYDYVICVARPSGKVITLDASQPYNGYGQLPSACYNGWGHVINESRSEALRFAADSVHESSLTSVLIFNDDKGNSTGSYSSILGKIESYNMRRKINSETEKEYEKKIRNDYGADIEIENFRLDSLKKYDFPLTVAYDFNVKNSAKSDILYFDPMMGDVYKKNPFASMNRHYPVEIPYQMDETYILNMDIPIGYQVDELPKSARVAYNETEGMFEYIIQKGAENIQMRVRLKLNKAFFPADEYSTLRDFFAFVVKKESEQIVFKKIKQ